MRSNRDRGSAAVEFAILLPVLLLILLGTVEFGRVFFLQNSITNAARVGARAMVIEAAGSNPSAVTDAKAAAIGAAVVSPSVTAGEIALSQTSCTPPSTGTAVYITVTITYPVNQLTGFMPAFPTHLIGKGTMRCDG